MKKLGVMIDCSRNSVMTVESLKKVFDYLQMFGYNACQLYTEDTFEVEDEPYFGYLRGRYTKQEIKELDAYAKTKGIELSPSIQTLAHLNQIFRWTAYQQINDCADILLARSPRTYELIDHMFKTLAECYTSREVNIGMDEAHMTGLGKYLDEHGYCPRADIIMEHLNCVIEIARKHGFTCSVWFDMFYIAAFGHEWEVKEPFEQIKDNMPQGLKLNYWDYYQTDKTQYDIVIKNLRKLGCEVVFTGGLWSWVGLVPRNQFAQKSTKAAAWANIRNDVDEIWFSVWGDGGGTCSLFSVLPSLWYAAEISRGNEDESDMKQRFEQLVGVPFDVFMLIDLPNELPLKSKDPKAQNPSKYLFYNDILLGALDTTIPDGTGEIYKDYAARLCEAERYEAISFVFKPIRLLCECLTYKADLGIKLRAAYRSGDRTLIRQLVEERLKPFVGKVEEFYDEFCLYWEKLFKPHGFDVMDIRIGGVLMRARHAVRKLERYLDGGTERVAELEEELLDYFGGADAYETALLLENRYERIATVNRLSSW